MTNGNPEPEKPKQTGTITPLKILLEDKMNWMGGVMVAIIIILVMGFVSLLATTGTLVWNAHMWGVNTYQDLVKELDDNNDEIDSLSNKVNDYNSKLGGINSDLMKVKTYFGIK